MLFGEIGGTLGAVALRVDHIGSTAVPGLAAKPIIDVQISVAALGPIEAFKDPLELLGYVYRADNPERTKRYFRGAPGSRQTPSGALEAFPSKYPCCCATICDVTPMLRPSSPPSSGGWPGNFLLTAALHRRQGPYVWEIIRRRTSGPRCKAGSRDQAMPESGAITGGDERLRVWFSCYDWT